MPTFQTLNTGMHPLQREWLLHANSGSAKATALGSGAVVATMHTGGGWIKAIQMSTPNTPAFALRDNAATIVSFASGAVGLTQFQPCWYEFKNTFSVAKASGTAETWYFLVATSAKDIAK